MGGRENIMHEQEMAENLFQTKNSAWPDSFFYKKRCNIFMKMLHNPSFFGKSPKKVKKNTWKLQVFLKNSHIFLR